MYEGDLVLDIFQYFFKFFNKNISFGHLYLYFKVSTTKNDCAVIDFFRETYKMYLHIYI